MRINRPTVQLCNQATHLDIVRVVILSSAFPGWLWRLDEEVWQGTRSLFPSLMSGRGAFSFRALRPISRSTFLPANPVQFKDWHRFVGARVAPVSRFPL